MEFGMFHEFPSLPGRSESEAFDEAMEQVDAAERLGLDVMWFAELHFEPRRSLLSTPLSIASAAAARTRRVARVQELRHRTYDEALETNLLVGAPDTVAAKLAALGFRG